MWIGQGSLHSFHKSCGLDTDHLISWVISFISIKSCILIGHIHCASQCGYFHQLYHHIVFTAYGLDQISCVTENSGTSY